MGDERYRGYASDVQRAGQHLLSLINDVLDLSKVEAGKVELHDELVVVQDTVHNCLTLITERAERKKLTLGHAIAANLPRLSADARLVRQVMLNLLSNAVKFTPAGGSVTVSAARTADGGLELAVADTGIGIAPEDLAHVLEPFGQVDSDLARQHADESTGLGLPLAKRFVELHGGRLALDSAKGRGTKVSAIFPAQRVVG